MEDFLDIVLPPLLGFLAVAALIITLMILSVSRTRLWAAKRRQALDATRIIQAKGVLDTAADALATVISDSGANGDTRNQALAAYRDINEIRGRK